MTTLQPMSSEQNDLEIQQQTAFSSKLLSQSSQPCDDEKDGAEDYDPTKDAAEQAQAAKDAADDVANDDAKAGDSEAEFVPASVEVDEAELVNSEQFAEELQSAIDHVTEIAKTHRAEMLRAAKRQFERETGKAPTQKMVDDAMETMKESLVERAVESEAQSAHIDSLDSAEATESEVGAVSAAEMESALEFVRELGRTHRVELEERFREQFSDVNDGAEPTAKEMSGIFARVREQFAEEARDEFLDIHDQEELEGDSDYEPSADQFTFEHFKDLEDEYAESEAEEPLRPNPLSFREEMDLALSHVRELASEHRDEFANRICDIYYEANGEATELGDLVEMMRISKVGLETEFKSSNQRELEQLQEMAEFAATHSEESLAEEMESALELVRDLGSVHQSDFVNSICDTFASLNGEEPSAEDLREMFQDIKISFAEEAISSVEARELEFDANLSDDADYSPSDDSFDYEADDADQSAFDAEFDAEILSEVIQELNEELLANEMNFALEHVQNLAISHQSEFVNAICDIFAEENGTEASAAELYSIFGAIKQGFADEAREDAEESVSEAESELESVASVSESEAESVAESAADSEAASFDEEAFDEDMQFALKHVRDLGALHQSEFVGSICELYAEEYGAEPSTDQLYEVFSGIQQLFAREADQEGSAFVVSVKESAIESQSEEESEEDLSEQDSYDPDEDSFDYAVDAESELESESVDESEAESADYSERDSYNPSEDSFDYAVDAEDSVAFASISASASESATESEAESERESYAVSDVNSLDVEDGTEYSESEQESEDDFSEQDSYDPEEDSFDYAVDAEDDIDSEFESAESSAADSELSVDVRSEYESEEESQSEAESEDDLSEKDSYDPEEDSFDYTRDAQSSISTSVSEADSAESSYASVDESVSASAELSESEAVSESEVQFDDDVRDELDFALSHVRDLAISHRSEFVNKICDIISAETAQEPTTAELYGLFGSVKQQFAEEALEESESESEFVEAESEYESVQESESESEQESEEDLSEQDSYDPDEDSFDYAVDAEDDIESEFQIDAESELESESVDESEAESADYSERDSYNPSEDSFDYAVDAEDSVAFASSASESASESEAESSVSASVSESESEAESVVESVSASEASEIMDRESVELNAPTASRVSELWADEFGEEATTENIRTIFDEVLQMFADEAEEEQYDETDEESEAQEQDESVNGEELSDAESVDAQEEGAVLVSENDMDETVRETYESEMVAALNTVRFVASEHQSEFFDTISNLYAEQYGEQPTEQELSSVLKQIQDVFAQEAEIDSEEFTADFESALEHTREVAASHREDLVNSICDIFSQINGKEATVEDLSGIFGRIRQEFAEEAEEEINENDSEDDSEDADSDYNPDSDAFDYSLDAADDECASDVNA